MGVEGTCRSGNRGGCPLSYAHYIAGIPFCPLVFPFPAYNQGKKHQKQGKTGQNGAKVRIYLVRFGVFSGFWETRRGEI